MDLTDFDQLYREHADRLFGFLAYRVGDDAAAEDLLADTFERAMRARRRFDPQRGAEAPWLYAIALNLVRDRYRRAQRERRALAEAVVDADPATPSVEAAVGERSSLAAAMATLSVDEREVVALRFGADLTVPELARLLRTRQTTVDGRLYRALRKLRAALEDAPGANASTSATTAVPKPASDQNAGLAPPA